MSFWRRWRAFWRAEFLSPKDLVLWAAMFALVFAIAHLCGMREYTSIINGTTGAVGMSFEESAILGVVYLLLYMSFVLLVPILLIAAGISKIWLRITADEPRTSPPQTR
jgi:hypothetical protein